MDDPDRLPSEPHGTENDPSRSPVRSPSEEPAGGSDQEGVRRRRKSWTMQESPQHPYSRSRSRSGSGSRGDLAMDTDSYWESRDHGRSPSRDMSVQREGHEREYRDDDSDDEFRSHDRTNNEHDQPYRSPSPVGRPPPPKPEKLNYKEKFLLRGHLRGVSAVRFSPDSSMIASGGIYCV